MVVDFAIEIAIEGAQSELLYADDLVMIYIYIYTYIHTYIYIYIHRYIYIYIQHSILFFDICMTLLESMLLSVFLLLLLTPVEIGPSNASPV